jgi:prophage regulatory protein
MSKLAPSETPSVKTKEAADVQSVSTDRLLRLRQVLELIPVSRSTWFAGVRSGRFPSPVRVGARAVAWRQGDIQKIVQSGIPTSRGRKARYFERAAKVPVFKVAIAS